MTQPEGKDATMKKQLVVKQAIESLLAEQSEAKLIFVIRALIAAGHVPEELFRESVKLASWVKL